jgi:hypothetical protein
MTRGAVNATYAIAAIALFLFAAVPALATTGGPGLAAHAAPLAVAGAAPASNRGSGTTPSGDGGSPFSTGIASSSSISSSAIPSLPIDHFALVSTPLSARPLGPAVSLPYSTAASNMLAAAAGFDGHTWTIYYGIGIALPYSETYSTTMLEGAPLGCTISWIGTQPSTLSLPATPSSALVGTAAGYEFVLESTAVPQFNVLAFEVNGVATLLYEESSACVSIGSNPGTTQPATTTALDSPAVVAIADRAGGSAFLQQNPTALQEWILEGGSYAITENSILITNPPYWIVQDVASCGSFAAEIDGLTGAVLANHSSCDTAPSYTLTFTETGLPAGTLWTVGLSGSVNQSLTTSIGFSMENGSYAYTVADVAGFAPTVATGTENVSGTDINVSVAFATATTFNVTFQETGLPLATFWAVELENITLDSNASSLVFVELNGSHHFDVTEFGNWSAAPVGGKARVNGANLNIPVVFSQPPVYQVNLTESGLPNATLWGLFFYGYGGSYENFTSAASLVFEVPNGTYFLEVASADPFYYNSTGFGLIVVAGANAAGTVNFTARPAYSLTFNETGLLPGDGWFVQLSGSVYQLNSSTGANLGFVLPNGTYDFTAGGAPGYNVTPINGTVVLNGTSDNVSLLFSGPVAVVETFMVSFSETGLPVGTSWSATLLGVENSSTSSSIGFWEPNGTDAYTIAAVAGYQATPNSGNVVVSGLAVVQTIAFTPLSTTPTYRVTFTESDLTSGTSWSVTFAGVVNSSTTTTVTFLSANGTFAYTVATVTGYTASPNSGSVTVAGAATGEAVTFTAVTPVVAKYTVTFTESGLPSGTTWSVTYNGATLSDATDSIAFSEANGTYSFTIGSVTGYTASPGSGSLGVTGAAASQSITFTATGTTTVPPASHSNSSTFLGLPSTEGYALVVLLVLIVLALVGFAVWRAQKGRGGSSSTTTTTDSTSPPTTPPSSP